MNTEHEGYGISSPVLKYHPVLEMASICQYTTPELLFIPEFDTGTYQYVLHP
jgi:hypothetical protein